MLKLIDRFLESDTSQWAGPVLAVLYGLALIVMAVAVFTVGVS